MAICQQCSDCVFSAWRNGVGLDGRFELWNQGFERPEFESCLSRENHWVTSACIQLADESTDKICISLPPWRHIQPAFWNQQVLFHLIGEKCSSWNSLISGILEGGLPTPTFTIHPKNPLVERGGSIQLTCSMDCPGGKVQWEGLDTDLGNVVSSHTTSVLTIAKATVNMEGVKICTGQCEKKPYQNKVDLQVYSFPDTLQLESQPPVLTAGQTARLFCSMSHVYPPGALTLSWFRGAEELDATEELNEEEMEESQEQLFLYRSVLEVPTTVEGTAYTCRATLEVEQKTFSREKVANVTLQATQRAPITMEETTSILKTVRTSHVAPPELSTTTDRISFVTATSGLPPLNFTEPHTTAAPAVPSKAVSTLESVAKTDTSGSVVVDSSLSHIGIPSVEMGRRSPMPEPSSTTIPPHVTETKPEVTSTDGQFTTRPDSTESSALPTVATEKLPHFSTPEKDSCRPVIKLVPPQGTTGGALRISCHVANCSDTIGIRWVETPVSQAQYQVEEAKGHLTLMVESVGLEHQGVYRCLATTSQPRMASVRVVVSKGMFGTDSLIAIGTAGSLLGLVITGYVSHRLRRRRGGWKQAAS